LDGGEKVSESRRGGVLRDSRGDCEGAETGNKSARRDRKMGNGKWEYKKDKRKGGRKPGATSFSAKA
jgi:hypothetical protein